MRLKALILTVLSLKWVLDLAKKTTSIFNYITVKNNVYWIGWRHPKNAKKESDFITEVCRYFQMFSQLYFLDYACRCCCCCLWAILRTRFVKDILEPPLNGNYFWSVTLDLA